MPEISSCQKNVSYVVKSINIRTKRFYHGFLVRKHKDTGQCMVQKSIYAAAKAINDDRILRLCENSDFPAEEGRCHKECTYST